MSFQTLDYTQSGPGNVISQSLTENSRNTPRVNTDTLLVCSRVDEWNPLFICSNVTCRLKPMGCTLIIFLLGPISTHESHLSLEFQLVQIFYGLELET